MKNFVIVFDRDSAKLLQLRTFDDPDEALAHRFAAELYSDDHEIVVLRAMSESDIRHSHPRYFAGTDLTDRDPAR